MTVNNDHTHTHTHTQLPVTENRLPSPMFGMLCSSDASIFCEISGDEKKNTDSRVSEVLGISK